MSILQRIVVAVAAMVLVLVVTKVTMRSDAQYQKSVPPKEVVSAFQDLAFAHAQPREAVLKYVAKNVVDHDPEGGQGQNGMIVRLTKVVETTAGARSEVKSVISEGDLVSVHRRVIDGSNSPAAVVDIYRVKDGHIIEHWDVMQAVPLAAASRMF